MPRRVFTEPETFQRVLRQILDAAARQGIDEGALAIRAGAAPETLSRMKSRSNGDFGLVARLARVAGLRLTAVPDNDTLEALERGEFF